MKNIAILGLGNIAHRVAKGILCSHKACLYAVASRDLNKAQDFAQTYGAKTFYGSYEEMLKDKNVDLVYICTPNTLHYEQIKLCLSYKKHVICEKPMVQNKQQVVELFQYAKQQECFLMEAHKTMFTPLNRKLKNLIDMGLIGTLKAIKAEYSCNILEDVNEDHWILKEDFGGCSYDIGVYPICVSHFFADSDITEYHSEAITHPHFQCDFGMDVDLFYENGIYATLKANWYYTPEGKGKALLIGDKGYIEIPAYWKGTQAFLYQNGSIEEIRVEMESDFEGEITHAMDCIEQGLLESPMMNQEMSLKIIEIVESVQECLK